MRLMLPLAVITLTSSISRPVPCCRKLCFFSNKDAEFEHMMPRPDTGPERGDLECTEVGHADTPDSFYANFLVSTVIMTVSAHTIRRAAEVMSEALAVLLQTLCTAAPASTVTLAALLIFVLLLLPVPSGIRLESICLIYSSPLQARTHTIM